MEEIDKAADELEAAQSEESAAFNAVQETAKAAYDAQARRCVAIVEVGKKRERYVALWTEFLKKSLAPAPPPAPTAPETSDTPPTTPAPTA